MTPTHFRPVGPDAATRYAWALGPPADGQARTLCGLVATGDVLASRWEWSVTCPACLARMGR